MSSENIDDKCDESILNKTDSYKEIFYNDHTVMLLIDPDSLRIVDANLAAINFYGYSLEELVKLKISDINIAADDFVLENIQKSVSKEKNHFIFKHQLSNGEIRDVEVYSGLIKQNGKKVLYSIIHDITDDPEQTILKRLYTILSSMYGAILLVSDNNEIEFANQAFCDFFKLDDSPEELMGLDGDELIGKIKGVYLNPEEAILRIRKIVLQNKPIKGEEVKLNGDRTCVRDYIPINISNRSYGRLWHHYDITERKNVEEALKESLTRLGQVNRTLVALRDSSFAMMHATDEISYLDEVCRIVADDCGYSMVWIGLTENENKKVIPIVYAGFEDDYLKTLNITWDDTERGQGPTGTAIRTGKICICENMLTDPKFNPWREEAIKRGYASSIVLPLISKEKTFGTINIYSKETNPFSEEEKNLLKELAEDISYGITSNRLRAEHEKAEFERKTTVEFLHLVNESTDLQDLIHSSLNFFKYQSGCEAAGIRLLDDKDYPYYESQGFPEEFIQLENHLCDYDKKGDRICDDCGTPLLSCMCGNVIEGKFNPTQPFFTINGSFWTNSTSKLLSSTTEEDRQSRTRNRCNGEGYESVALIPLHSGEENLGLLQINDTRKNLFKKDIIELWERLAGHLSVALAKFIAEDEIINHDKVSAGINKVFQEFLTYDTEKEVIEKCLVVAEELTESKIGFFAELDKNGSIDDSTFVLTLKKKPPYTHKLSRNIDIINFWERTIKDGKSHIVNEPNNNYYLKDLPEGHPQITSFLGVPLKEGKKTIGMIGLINKKSGYNEMDKKNVETLSVAFVEVLMRKKAEIKIQDNLKDLEQSNKELEQFAYITSHDLREPLRMITSFLQLLKKRYNDKLDQDANEFIGYAVDGAKRLDAMTNDLLQYSKITSQKRENLPVNFEHVLEHAVTNLKVQIEENNAVITHDPLPTIQGDEQLKIQLFQNLISNSIKYRREETPKIHVSVKKEKYQYLFSIKDNGIGMSPVYLNKIFTIFQRLHTLDEYEGTGIGLAIAQKIVHQQGGEIWAESEPGKGSTFYFTVPIKK